MTTTAAPDLIIAFSGEWRFLSNFAPCPWVSYDGERYPTVEHAYQAAKTDDRAARQQIRQASKPGIAKALGRHVRLRGDWELTDAYGVPVKVQVMRDLLLQKFAPGQAVAYHAGLLRTGDARLIEGNTWGDRFWGCTLAEGGEIGRPYHVGPTGQRWFGENRLGELQMQIRTEYRAARALTQQ